MHRVTAPDEPEDSRRPADESGGPASPDLVEREVAAEQAHVDLVYARLADATRTAQEVASAGRSLYQSDRGSYVREEDGTGLYERDVFAFQAAKRLAVLDAEHEGLVFGRLDRTDGEVRYVGRIGVRDADYEPLVIDWRARAAEPFYRATPHDPMQVVRRRVLRCQGQRVVGIEDDLLDGENARDDLAVVGEGALMAALSRARGHTMRDIVATIQGEQDEAIRAPYQGFTMISGGPGTGKTVVALHRAAYLLYSNRRRFTSGGVLVVGPSLVFMNYIERVLPSLGEESVTLRPVGTVAADVVRLAGDRVDDAPTSAVKGSLRMVRVLRRLVQEPPQAVPLELRLTLKGHVLVLRVDALERIRADVLAHHKLNAGREAAEKALLQALWRGRPAELDLERDEFDDAVTDTAAFTMFLLAWWPGVSAPTALARLGDRGLLARLAGSTLSEAEQDRLAASYPRTADLARTADWTVADGALLDELVSLLGPVTETEDRDEPLFLPDDAEYAEVVTTADRLTPVREVDPFAEPHETYSHVLVDEAQDITPMQWRMLRRRGAGASWTIVGDPAQSSWPDAAETDRALQELVGTAPVRRFRMSTNYRSPAEVFDLAASVVVQAYPEADLPKAVRSTGVAPLLLVADERGVEPAAVDAVADLLTQVEGTVGVICPPTARDGVRAALDAAALPGAERLAVVTSLESKGLEYDGVLVVDPDRLVAESPGGVRSLYVALTRPTQRLVTLDAAGAGSPGWRRSLG
ncbi:DNA helicase IV [Friedmanniella luteola]|uniref:DNA helicase IV n=1 Tax=Friedmanniella luteola TaxID=546871 RepID=A0A1H1P9I0_9ACTN|nr:DNA helicase IV [Friedmanniella luteola]